MNGEGVFCSVANGPQREAGTYGDEQTHTQTECIVLDWTFYMAAIFTLGRLGRNMTESDRILMAVSKLF